MKDSGKGVTRREIFPALWEEGEYNHSQQKYLEMIIRGLRDARAAKGVEDILEVKSGFYGFARQSSPAICTVFWSVTRRP